MDDTQQHTHNNKQHTTPHTAPDNPLTINNGVTIMNPPATANKLNYTNDQWQLIHKARRESIKAHKALKKTAKIIENITDVIDTAPPPLFEFVRDTHDLDIHGIGHDLETAAEKLANLENVFLRMLTTGTMSDDWQQTYREQQAECNQPCCN